MRRKQRQWGQGSRACRPRGRRDLESSPNTSFNTHSATPTPRRSLNNSPAPSPDQPIARPLAPCSFCSKGGGVQAEGPPAAVLAFFRKSIPTETTAVLAARQCQSCLLGRYSACFLQYWPYSSISSSDQRVVLSTKAPSSALYGLLAGVVAYFPVTCDDTRAKPCTVLVDADFLVILATEAIPVVCLTPAYGPRFGAASVTAACMHAVCLPA